MSSPDVAVAGCRAVPGDCGNPSVLGHFRDRLADLVGQLIVHAVADLAVEAPVDQAVHRAGAVGPQQQLDRAACPAGICASAGSAIRISSAAVFDPALPGRRIPASASRCSSSCARSG